MQSEAFLKLGDRHWESRFLKILEILRDDNVPRLYKITSSGKVFVRLDPYGGTSNRTSIAGGIERRTLRFYGCNVSSTNEELLYIETESERILKNEIDRLPKRGRIIRSRRQMATGAGAVATAQQSFIRWPNRFLCGNPR